MMPKSKTVALWTSVIILLLGFAWSVNLMLFNWWASSGPPVQHPEIYKSRGNVFFAIACALLLGLLLVVRSLIRRYRETPSIPGGEAR